MKKAIAGVILLLLGVTLFFIDRSFDLYPSSVNQVQIQPKDQTLAQLDSPMSKKTEYRGITNGITDAHPGLAMALPTVKGPNYISTIVNPTGKGAKASVSRLDLQTETVNGRQVSFVKNQLMIKLTRGAAEQDITEFLARHNLTLIENNRLKALRYASVTIPEGTDMLSARKAMAEDPQARLILKTVEPNYVARAMTIEDPLYPEQWYMGAVGFDKAWGLVKSTNHVLVAVVDTGVDESHPDLEGRCLSGFNTISENQDTADEHGHGTFTAGLIAAAWNNVGIRGVCPANVDILPVKTLDSAGQGTYENAAEGIVAAADAGARVINLGFGGYAYSNLLKDAVDYAIEKGCVVVAAGGNDGTDAVMYPAGYPDVVGVGALGKDGQIAPFSNSGPHIDVVAPGEDVLSTVLNGGYERYSGTSCSAAMVSGLAALLLGEKPELSAFAFAQALSPAASNLGERGRGNVYGAVRIDATGAVSSKTKAFHDLAVTGIDFDSLVFDASKPAQVLVTVRNNGTYSDEMGSVVIYRVVDGQDIELGRQMNLSISGTLTVAFNWTPAQGETNVLFQAIVAPEIDSNPANNKIESRCYSLRSNGGLHVLYEATEAPVHQWIAYQAFKKLKAQGLMTSFMESEFQDHIGATSDNDSHLVVGWSPSSTSWGDVLNAPALNGDELLEGTWEEDGEAWDLSYFSPVTHFWNPHSDFNTGLGYGYLLSFPSALKTAQDRFANALSDYASSSVNGKKRAYYWLGRTAHLLMDMSVPAHVGCHNHRDYDGYENFTKSAGLYRGITYTSAHTEIPDYDAIFTYLRSFEPNDHPNSADKLLTSLVWDLAEYADDFGAYCNDTQYAPLDNGFFRDRVGDLPNYNNDWLVQQQQLQSRAIGYVAALYRLFWERTARYREIQVTVSASPVGKGLKVEVDGIEYTESHTFTWEKGVSHTIETTFAQNGYTWESWNDVGDSENAHTVTPQANAQYIASFSLPSNIQLAGIAITGPAAITETGSGQFSATAYFSDGSSKTVNPSWSENSSVTSISSSGSLNAGSVSGDTLVTVTASYTEGGVTKTTSANVTIVNAVTGGGPQTVHALANGTFESGTASWVTDGTAEVFAGSYPHAGSQYAYLCNANDAVGAIAQFIPVPAGTTAATLSFYINISSEETAISSQFDTMEVSLLTENDEFVGTVANFSNLDKRANGSYVIKSYNIMPLIDDYKGQSIFVVFHGETDDSNTTIFRIDDVDVSLTVDNPITLAGLSIRGPSSIPENLGGAFYADAYFSDGTIQTVSASSWGENSPATTFSSDMTGFLYSGSVSADTVATLTATYSFNGVNKQATKNVTVVDATVRTFTRLSVSGSSSINEFSTEQFLAEAIFSDGTSQNVSPVWSENSSVTTISSSGLLSAGEVAGDKAITVSASLTLGGVTRVGTRNVTVQNVDTTPTLVSISLSGNIIVNESSSAQYTCTANYSDGSQFDVSGSALWYDNSTNASINGYGYLTTSEVWGHQPCRITVTYMGKSTTYDMTIKDLSIYVSFDAQGGVVSPLSKTVIIGSAYGSMPTPTKLDYSFKGWWTRMGDTDVQVTERTMVTATSNHTVLAKWEYAFQYISSGSAITITHYIGSGGEVIVPETIDGLPVISLGSFAFANCTGLTNITIPVSVTSIGDYAFINCCLLTSVTIPDCVTSIGTQAFKACTNLTSVSIGNSVINIGNYAFHLCTSLTSVFIPTSVASIGTAAFSRCYSLKSITVGEQNTAYSSVAGILFNKSQTVLVEYPGGLLGHYTVPDGVISIGSYAFYSCTNQLSVTMPVGVTSIGVYAFYNCPGLTSITIPASVNIIGHCAFQMCTALDEIYFKGNSPSHGLFVLSDDSNATVYVLQGTIGWGLTFADRPTALWYPDSLLTVNGGCGSGSYNFGQKVAVTADAPAIGKMFDRWTGATQHVASVSLSTAMVTMPAEDVILTAVFKVMTFTVTFDGNGGATPNPQSMIITNGLSYGTLATTTRMGFTFAGWYTDQSETGTEVNTSTTATNTEAQTLYAKWEVSNDSQRTPFLWLDQYGLVVGGNYDAAAMADVDGDGHAAWQEYVAGSDPTKRESFFRALISVSNNAALIRWSPDLGTARVYSVSGKTNLVDAAWGPTNAASRFFRVNVEMP